MPLYSEAGVQKFAFLATDAMPGTVEKGGVPAPDGPATFPTAEIEESTGIAVIAELPSDSAAAAMLAGRPDPRGALSRLAGRGGIAGLPLAKAAAELANTLAVEHLRVGESAAEAGQGVEDEPIGAVA